MAKPFDAQPSSSPGPSNPSPFHPQSSTQKQVIVRHRSRRLSTQPPSKAAPSTTLLSLLASLASASTVYGSPAPPSFLCPTLESGEPTDCTIAKRAPTQSYKAPARVVDIKNTISHRNVPARYSQQADGTWRRVGSYTLYGSTMPACSSSCATPTAPVISPQDNQIQVDDNPDPTTTGQLLNDITTDLPPGWKPLEKHSRTAVILLISLFLALSIGSFIVCSMFWRNRVKARHRSRDVEAKAKKRRHMNNEADVREMMVEKEIKAKQKIWAKATARWRNNARFSARQRRGRRMGSRLSQSNHSSASLDNSRSCLAESSSLTQSRHSAGSSTVSLGDHILREDNPLPPSSSPQEEIVIADSGAPEVPVRISPPAYHHHGQIPSLMISPGEVIGAESLASSHLVGKEHLLQSPHSSADTSHPSIPITLHAAHVATDDKALLARLAELASAPPEDQNEGVSEPVIQTSAPEWHDDDLEDVAPYLLTQPSTQLTFSPMFPPPPPKQRLAAAEFYDYSYAFDEVAPSDLEAGPSAPPFEEGSSPPEHELLPSAPPLFEDGEVPPDSQPSAPIWDPSPHRDHEWTDTTGEGQEPLEDTQESSTARGPFSGTSGSPVRDSITLPGYQP